ncbi:SgcJ/EcaC family oxidoreductase [Pseudonocardia acaciae]|uniref:SgcJ/EcaC family oxidoreductase n=1 Tax=Pseudonocardia acaciae TaxID=551276 RepID=UPI00048C3B12|nr:SgcJ/EcaC family oxidoreductase [Pseudonocardia acaciae]
MTTTDTKTTTEDEAAVRAVLDGVYAAWAAGDADALAAHYTEDATVILHSGVFSTGSNEVRDAMAAGFAGPLRGSRAFDRPLDLRFLGPDTAVVIGEGGILMAGERELPPARQVRATWVLTRRDGRWLVAAYHNCLARPA